MLENVARDGNGSVQYAVAGNGTLAYVSAPHVAAEYELVWIDREGRTETLLESVRPLAFPRLSPDGSQVAMTIVDGANLDVWLFDLGRRSLTQRLTTHPGEDFGAVWHPDGRQLALGSEVGGEHGAGTANYDVAPDGSRFLLARRKNPVTATVIDVVLNWPQTLLASQATARR